MPEAHHKPSQLQQPGSRFLQFARVDASQRMVYGYLTTEAEDSYGTIFALDATREALAEYEQWRTLRAMHEPVAAGTVPILELDDKGLWIGARVVDDAEWAKVEAGVYKGFSIGFDPLDGREEQRDGRWVFVFTRYKLIEASLVDRPSNPDCLVMLWTRKAGFLLAAKDAGWTWDWKTDADAILAKGGQKMLARACAWHDPSAADDDGDGYPDAKNAYKLPVAKLAASGDSELTLYFYGVVAAMAALNGAHGGTNIPDSDRQKVYDLLASYYKLFKETAPPLARILGTPNQEDIMDEKEIQGHVEKGIRAFFSKIFGPVQAAPPAPQAAPPAEPKLRLKADEFEGLKALQTRVAGFKGDKRAEAAAAALTALIEGAEPEAAAPPAAAPPAAQPDLAATIEAQARALDALRAELDAVKSQRTSVATLPDDKKTFKSRYGGAFFGN